VPCVLICLNNLDIWGLLEADVDTISHTWLAKSFIRTHVHMAIFRVVLVWSVYTFIWGMTSLMPLLTSAGEFSHYIYPSLSTYWLPLAGCLCSPVWSELHSRWRRWHIVHCMVPHHLTWHRHSHLSPTCRIEAGSGPPPLNSLTFWPVVGQLYIGGRAFPVAKVWNGLPSDVTSASALSVFKNRLKTYLFCRCYETVWL